MQRSSEEEVVNALTHFLAAIVAAVMTLIAVVTSRDGSAYIPLLLIGCTATWGFFSSFLYHASKTTRSRDMNFINDRAAIYIMIAGSGVGLCLSGAQDIHAALFSIALLLICFLLTAKMCLSMNVSETFIVLSYVLFGWFAVLPSVGLVMQTNFSEGIQFWLLLSGGLAYSAGAVFYVRDKPWDHAIWHAMVMIGFGLHLAGCYICVNA